ncbi:hypothetical protein BKI52_30350 [marine bacterium AO1-C]|nr:hypothetical protein BKI52_30350 [marine bacterium AO1-C]
MRVFKITAGLACGVTLLLFVLASTSKSPEAVLYKKTVEMLMKQEGLTSAKEIEAHFPSLKDVRSHMRQIAELKQVIASKNQNPAPVIGKEETLKLAGYQKKIRQLQRVVRTKLSQLTATYAENNHE